MPSDVNQAFCPAAGRCKRRDAFTVDADRQFWTPVVNARHPNQGFDTINGFKFRTGAICACAYRVGRYFANDRTNAEGTPMIRPASKQKDSKNEVRNRPAAIIIARRCSFCY